MPYNISLRVAVLARTPASSAYEHLLCVCYLCHSLIFLMLAFFVDEQQNSLSGSILPSLGSLTKLLFLELYVSRNV